MDDKLGNLIKQKREEIGISQRELARIINVDNATISKIENGNVEKPSFEVLIKISKELNISIYKLMKYSNYEDIERLFYTSKYDEIYQNELLQDINENNLKNVISIIEDRIVIDIHKVLEQFKKDNINEKETIKLITACIPIEMHDELIYESENGNIVINLKNNPVTKQE